MSTQDKGNKQEEGTMDNENKSVGAFIQGINKEIVSALISKQQTPLRPEKDFICFMQDTRVHFELRVNAKGEVTDGQSVAARLHFDFCYSPEKEEEKA